MELPCDYVKLKDNIASPFIKGLTRVSR